MSNTYYLANQKEYYIYYNDKDGDGHIEYVYSPNDNLIHNLDNNY